MADTTAGTQAWVEFPTLVLSGISITSPLFGGELLIDDAGAVTGVEIDTAIAGDSGNWEATATLLEADDAEKLNFRTSADSGTDIEVALPGDFAVLNDAPASVAAARSIGGGSRNDNGITVDIINIENAETAGAKLQRGQSARINGTWDSEDGAVAGNSFKVTFPEVFGLHPGSDFDLVGDDGGTYGFCTILPTPREANCVLSDEVEDRTGVHGTWHLYVDAVAKTDEANVIFELDGGEAIEVPLPGPEGGIGDIYPLPTEMTKSGARGSDPRILTWTVDIPGQFLIDNNFDNPAVFTDTPSEDQKIVEDSGKVVYWENTDDKNANLPLTDGNVSFGPQNAGTNAFDVTINPGEEWDPYKVYRVSYQTRNDSLVAPDGTSTNSFGADGIIGVEGAVGGPMWKAGSFANSTREVYDWKILAPGSARSGNEIVIEDTLAAGPHEVTNASIESFQVFKMALLSQVAQQRWF